MQTIDEENLSLSNCLEPDLQPNYVETTKQISKGRIIVAED